MFQNPDNHNGMEATYSCFCIIIIIVLTHDEQFSDMFFHRCTYMVSAMPGIQSIRDRKKEIYWLKKTYMKN